MGKIVHKERLNDQITLLEIEAQQIAAKVLPGQFVIVRANEKAERIPLTIADHDGVKGTITLIVQGIGKTTKELNQLHEGDEILNVAGPLGQPTEFGPVSRACVIGGGVGSAIAYPSARWLFEHGVKVDIIAGFRNKDLIILEESMKRVSQHCIICTDDGSNGNRGFVTAMLQNRLDQGADYDLVIAIGPIMMMKAVADLTRPLQIRTLVSLNPIMIDGTGMCGGCRVTVGNKVRFACVDGPDFDAHQVDFDELRMRNATYRRQEEHRCRMMEEQHHG